MLFDWQGIGLNFGPKLDLEKSLTLNIIDAKHSRINKDRIAQKLLCFTHDLDTKHQRYFYEAT